MKESILWSKTRKLLMYKVDTWKVDGIMPVSKYYYIYFSL